MTTLTEERTETDKLAHAKEQARAQFESIKEKIERLRAADEGDDEQEREDARQAIDEDALSVEVRSDWMSASAGREQHKPTEYRILLCTGGPAVQIVGDLNQYCEPESARLECQDWFQPWTEYRPSDSDAENIMLAYAQCFWFGE